MKRAVEAVRIGNNYQREVLVACEGCGKEKWVRLLGGKPRTTLCNACARDKKVIQRCLICGKGFKAYRYLVINGFGKYCSSECRSIAQSRRITGAKHPMWNGGKMLYHCEECGEPFNDYQSAGRRFCSNTCNVINQRKKGVFCQTPNKAESALIALFGKNGLPFKYTGNGEVWFGNRNPDFINTNGRKQVIELFGTYWHPVFDVADRTEHYKKYAFGCLVIWEDELSNLPKLTQKIKRFANAK